MRGKTQRLYDTSALLNMVLGGSGSLASLYGQAALDLTVYELGNSIWKMSHLQKKIAKKEGCDLLDVCVVVMQGMRILSVSGMEEKSKEIASQTGMSFYDSAYVALAIEHNLVLVTDDKRLARAAARYTKVDSS